MNLKHISCCILIGSDSILREVGAGGAEKRFRNCASSNHDFILISINRTTLLSIWLGLGLGFGLGLLACNYSYFIIIIIIVHVTCNKDTLK